MSNRTMEPLELGHVEQGKFLQAADQEFGDLQHRILQHLIRHGDRAAGAKASLEIKITLELSKHKNDTSAIGIKATMKTTLPSRPAAVTLGHVEINEDGGRHHVLVQPTGSSTDNPLQKTFATEDGRPTAAVATVEAKDPDPPLV